MGLESPHRKACSRRVFHCLFFVHAAQLWVRKWQKMRSFAGGGHYSRGTIFEMKLMQHITADGVSIIL